MNGYFFHQQSQFHVEKCVLVATTTRTNFIQILLFLQEPNCWIKGNRNKVLPKQFHVCIKIKYVCKF